MPSCPGYENVAEKSLLPVCAPPTACCQQGVKEVTMVFSVACLLHQNDFKHNNFFSILIFFLSLVCYLQGMKEASMVFYGGLAPLTCLQIMLQMPFMYKKQFQSNDFYIEIAFFISLVCSPQGVKEATMVFDGGVPLPICLQIMLQMPLLHQLFAHPAFSAPSCPPQL